MGGVTSDLHGPARRTVPPWNFSVPGVTSISVDLHKYGYTAKGASVIMHRNKQLRGYQTFVTDNWLGGLYGSSGVLGTKGGGSMAAAWAVMHHLGNEGYLRVTGAARRGVPATGRGSRRHSRAHASGPSPTRHWWPSVPPTKSELDIFAVADALWRRGWYVDRQGPPPSLHCTVSVVHDGKIEAFVADLHGEHRRGGRARRERGEQGATAPSSSAASAAHRATRSPNKRCGSVVEQ